MDGGALQALSLHLGLSMHTTEILFLNFFFYLQNI